MSVTSRSYTRIAIAIVIAAVIISASALSYASFEATVTKTVTTGTTTTSIQVSTTTVTTTSTATCPEGESNATSASTTDCQLGITLGVATNTGPPYVPVGFNETFHLSLTNDLGMARNVNYTSFPPLPDGVNPSSAVGEDYILPLLPPCAGIFPSTSGYVPAFIAVYNSSGAQLQLNDSPPSLVSCVSLPSNHYRSFNASQTINETLSLGGFYTSTDASEPWLNATYSQFGPGDYTVVAFDPWNQTADLNFSVLETSSAPAVPQVVIPSGASANNALNFEPSVIRVVIGVNNTVVFTNDDKIAATIESTSWPTNASGFEDLLNPGQSWAVELTAPGVYNYTNGFHPVWMNGAILVSPLPLALKSNISEEVANPGSTSPAYSIEVNLSEFNTISTYTNVSAVQNWPTADLSLGPCGTFEFPFGVVLYQGHYTSQNISSGTPLTIYTPNANETSELHPEDCPANPQVFSYVFAPLSDNAVVKLAFGGETSASTYALSDSVSIIGYWSESSSSSASEFHALTSGVYTVLAADEWGTVVIAHVTVQ
jgi:plastocyanin